MSLTAIDLLVRHVRHVADGRPDHELLERFAAGDESAFADLLRRHGPMVRGVCLRLLGDPGLADDAFQSTFLVLAQRAGSVRRRESVGSWLYGVAWRLAHKARRTDTRRRQHERAAAEGRRLGATDPRWAELLALLDKELGRLPEQARAPLLLCYLQGRTQDEAARSLGWSVGTLRRRLERGRDLLRARLAGRGATLPAALFAAALAPGGATAAVPDGLLAETVRAATAALTAGWSWGRKAAALVLLAAGVVGAGAVGRSFLAAPPESAKPAPPAERAAGAKPSSVAGKDRLGDPLPDGALVRFGSTRFRHPGGIQGAALSQDGKTIATVGRSALRLTDTATDRARFTLMSSQFPEANYVGVPLLAFSPDSRRLLVSGTERAYLLDAATGNELRRIKTPGMKVPPVPGPFSLAVGVAFSPDGKQFAVAAGRGTTFFDAATGKERFSIAKADKQIAYWLSYAPDGRIVALPGAAEGTVRLCDAATGKEVGSFASGVEVVGIAFAPGGKNLAVAGADSAVRLWDVATCKEVRDRRFKPAVARWSGLFALAFAPDGKSLAVAAGENPIRLYDLVDGKTLRQLKGHTWDVTGLCFSRDGKTLYSASYDRTIRRWDVRSGEEVRGPENDLDQSRMARSADGKLVATAGMDGPITLWDATTGRRLRVLRGHRRGVFGLAFSPDGRRLASGGLERSVHVWDVAGGKEERKLDCGSASEKHGRVGAVAFSPDGRLLAACDNGRNVVHLWDAVTGKKLREPPHKGPTTLAFAPDGKALAVGGWDNSAVELWDVATGRRSRSIGGGKFESVNAVAYSPNGRLIATGHHNSPVRLYDAATGELVRQIEAGHQVAWCLAFSPDGAWLATGGLDGTAGLWEVATGRQLHRLRGHEFWVLTLAFGPDGRTLATGGYDGTSLLWSLKRMALRSR